MEGTCNCGAVRVRVTDPNLFTQRRGHLCHCFNCRKTSGSSFGTNLLIESDKVALEGAENLTVYEDGDSLSGNVVKRFFCRTCGCSIKSETPPATEKGAVILKLGIFPKVPHPEMETFVKHRHPWLPKQEGAIQFLIARGGEKAE